MKNFIQHLSKRVLLCDGATGTQLQKYPLDLKRDFLGLENCSEILTLTRPDVITNIHRDYLEAGADLIETNTFGANKIILNEFRLTDKIYELNITAAKLARQIADEFSTVEWPRFVVGSIGPGTKLPTLGQITYDELVDSYAEQVRGLLEGQVDLLLLETHQDLLTIKACLQGCRIAKKERHDTETPIFVQLTLDQHGTTLIGADMPCIVTTLAAMDVDGLGLNCGLGPAEMAEHVRYLSQHWNGFISVMPNAGLPQFINGQAVYQLSSDQLAQWQRQFVDEMGVNLIGGCCGTSPLHIAALRKMLDARSDKAPIIRHPVFEPAISSSFTAVSLRQENAVLSIGERTNANGSKQFRELLCGENIDGMIALAKEQEKEGSHALDICTAYVGRPESQDMVTYLSALRNQVTAPLMIDSTDPHVIENALKLLGGKSVINSIHFESSEEKARSILKLAKQFGSAVVGLAIDENGMAKTVEDKINIAKRLYDLAVNQYQLPAHDLFFDLLTFTICTGHDDDREHAIHTLKAVEQITKQFPTTQLLLGISNISFGLKPAARRILNSVFLHHAQEAGLTAAIIHGSKIVPLHQIPKVQLQAAQNLLFNRWEDGNDPLLHFIQLFSEPASVPNITEKQLPLEARLKQHVIEGNKKNLEHTLEQALQIYSPLEIINHYLLDGMKTVGELFGQGQTQLPFVLQSAETMKAAVTFLEKMMPNEKTAAKGTMILATVKGDVHDIGKNLVDIILTNNGYRVINLGIKQPIQPIIDAAIAHQANAIGLSGLLVTSTHIMKENLHTLREAGIKIPVILGGAALTRHFVEQDCQAAYRDAAKVYYAHDAFDALKWMETIIENSSRSF